VTLIGAYKGPLIRRAGRFEYDALFDAEIVIGHRAVPYLKGQVLHSVSPAATPDDPWSFRSCERPRVKIETNQWKIN
jgi:hypothetical protein